MKTKIYDLYSTDWQGISSYEFTHPEDRTEQFETDCITTARKYIPELLSRGGRFFTHEPGKKVYNTWCGIDGIIEIVAEKLNELGYIKLGDTIERTSFGMFGSDIIEEEKRGDDGNIVKLLGPELSKLIFNHNKKVEKSCNRSFKKYNEN
jgi:hypothetical protein